MNPLQLPAMAPYLDAPAPTVPADGHIEPGTRQQARRIARGKVRCCRCRQPVTTEQVPCFDDGKDAHLRCATIRNSALAEAREEMAQARAEALGLSAPRPGLWTPPSRPPASSPAPLDLSRGLLLSPTS